MKKLVLLSIILFVSCGTRKSTVNKSDTKTNTEIATNTNIQSDIKTETNSETGEITETETIEPINIEKPAVYKGQTITNAKIVRTKKTARNVQKVVKQENVKENKKEAVKVAERVITKDKVTERSFNYWWLLLLIIPVACYWVYRKYLV